MSLLPFVISSYIGYFLTKAILQDPDGLNPVLRIALAFGLGLSVSVHLLFYSYLVFNSYHPRTVLGLHLIICVFLAVWAGTFSPGRPQPGGGLVSHLKKIFCPSRELFSRLALAAFFLFALYLIQSMAAIHPYGEWDATAIWNLKSKFLILGGESWRNLFHLHRYTNTDNPLFLSLVHAWSWTLHNGSFTQVPFMTGIIFSLACAAGLWGGLAQHIFKGLAFLATALLVFLLPFLHSGTTQYADIVLSFYLLLSMNILMLSLVKLNRRYALISGFLIGSLPFIKNEGFIMAALLVFFSVIFISVKPHRTDRKQLLLPLALGLLLAVQPSLIIKTYSAYPLHFFVNKAGLGTNYDTVAVLLIAVKHFFEVVTRPAYSFLWLLLAFMALRDPRQYIRGETAVMTAFLVSYSGSILAIYSVTDYDPAWIITLSLERILLYLLPTILFLSFYTLRDNSS